MFKRMIKLAERLIKRTVSFRSVRTACWFLAGKWHRWAYRFIVAYAFRAQSPTLPLISGKDSNLSKERKARALKKARLKRRKMRKKEEKIFSASLDDKTSKNESRKGILPAGTWLSLEPRNPQIPFTHRREMDPFFLIAKATAWNKNYNSVDYLIAEWRRSPNKVGILQPDDYRAVVRTLQAKTYSSYLIRNSLFVFTIENITIFSVGYLAYQVLQSAKAIYPFASYDNYRRLHYEGEELPLCNLRLVVDTSSLPRFFWETVAEICSTGI